LKNGHFDSSVRDPMEIAFGFGRRWALYIFSFPLDHHRFDRTCPQKKYRSFIRISILGICISPSCTPSILPLPLTLKCLLMLKLWKIKI
jgi:hypothetical protein